MDSVCLLDYAFYTLYVAFLSKAQRCMCASHRAARTLAEFPNWQNDPLQSINCLLSQVIILEKLKVNKPDWVLPDMEWLKGLCNLDHNKSVSRLNKNKLFWQKENIQVFTVFRIIYGVKCLPKYCMHPIQQIQYRPNI